MQRYCCCICFSSNISQEIMVNVTWIFVLKAQVGMYKRVGPPRRWSCSESGFYKAIYTLLFFESSIVTVCYQDFQLTSLCSRANYAIYMCVMSVFIKVAFSLRRRVSAAYDLDIAMLGRTSNQTVIAACCLLFHIDSILKEKQYCRY